MSNRWFNDNSIILLFIRFKFELRIPIISIVVKKLQHAVAPVAEALGFLYNRIEFLFGLQGCLAFVSKEVSIDCLRGSFFFTLSSFFSLDFLISKYT
jgi:hypothetical protein